MYSSGEKGRPEVPEPTGILALGYAALYYHIGESGSPSLRLCRHRLPPRKE
jgi:hypothetical protein